MSTKSRIAIMAALATIVAAPAFADQPVRHAQPNAAVRPTNAATRANGHPFVPRKGFVDDACNLPSSGCPNELRDVN